MPQTIFKLKVIPAFIVLLVAMHATLSTHVVCSASKTNGKKGSQKKDGTKSEGSGKGGALSLDEFCGALDNSIESQTPFHTFSLPAWENLSQSDVEKKWSSLCYNHIDQTYPKYTSKEYFKEKDPETGEREHTIQNLAYIAKWPNTKNTFGAFCEIEVLNSILWYTDITNSERLQYQKNPLQIGQLTDEVITLADGIPANPNIPC